MKRILINEATADQLATFAEQQGIEIDRRWGAAKLRAAIEPAWTKDWIEIHIDEHEPVETVVPPGDKAETKSGDRWVTVVINEQEGVAGGNDPVPLSVNGRTMYVERGKPQRIRWPYFEALRNAKYFTYAAPSAMGEPLGERREVPRFPYSVIEMDPEPAVAA